MKTLFRYVLAATLAVTVYSFSNGSGNIAVVDDPLPSDEFLIVGIDHDQEGQVMTRQQIEDRELCEGEAQECALPTSANPLATTIRWGGPTTKF